MGSPKTKIGWDVNATSASIQRWFFPLVVIVVVTTVLAGCNRTKETKGALFPNSSAHVSPPPVEVPRLPAGSFDAMESKAERDAAAAIRQANDAAGARAHAEKAVMLWPADRDAWSELSADCAALKDLACQRYAAFFGAKVEFAGTLPPRMAVLGFASLNAAGSGVKAGRLHLRPADPRYRAASGQLLRRAGPAARSPDAAA